MDLRTVIVDDDAASARAIGSLFTALGFRVDLCTEPESAVALALNAGVDVVSLDLMMPPLDGYEVLALIRSHEHSRRAPNLPVIAITGSVTDDDRAHTIASGFAAHLGKPVTAGELRAALSSVVALRADHYRSRYTVDQDDIAERLDDLLARSGGSGSQVATGVALAMEQQGTQLLRQMLTCTYGGDFAAAAGAAGRLADAGRAIGASHFAALCAAFAAALGGPRSQVEQTAVLVRAELARVVYTLRERVLR
ncbi:MAG: response regulator [Rubrivivax sp.]|nr:response regulator [Rubrivivax sp.]MDP3082524.1 response regulator [Rubrivivax sp.]